MGFRGPIAKPAWMKQIDGNPGKRGVKSNELKPSKLVPWMEPPEYFDEPRRGVWNRLCKELSLVGALSTGDRFPLERYCEFLVKWLEIRHFLQYECKGKLSFPLKDKAGRVTSMKAVPEAKIFLEYSQHLLRIEQNFGLTPAARTRILLDNDDAGDDNDDFSDLDG